MNPKNVTEEIQIFFFLLQGKGLIQAIDYMFIDRQSINLILLEFF